jgi:hypothetical protein
MSWEEIAQALESKPFKPFRVHLSDGTANEVTIRGAVLLGRTSAYIGVKKRRNGHPRIYDMISFVSLPNAWTIRVNV